MANVRELTSAATNLKVHKDMPKKLK